MSILIAVHILAGLIALFGLAQAIRLKDTAYVLAGTGVLAGTVVLAESLSAGLLLVVGGVVTPIVRNYQLARQARSR